jgi:toxin FitB
MNWLIDTNVISETKKRHPDGHVQKWIESVQLSQMFTSTMNIAELVYGANNVKDVLKKRDLDQWIDTIVRPWFAGRLLEVDENILLR